VKKSWIIKVGIKKSFPSIACDGGVAGAAERTDGVGKIMNIKTV
jgi:hypothetical protein